MSCASCCCGPSASAAAPRTKSPAPSAVESRIADSFHRMFRCIFALQPRRAPLARIQTRGRAFCKPASPAVFTEYPVLFRVLHRNYLDLDQESGIGQRRDADNGASRHVRLAAAEKTASMKALKSI